MEVLRSENPLSLYHHPSTFMMKDFFDGAAAYGKALQLIGELRLWGYVVAPAIISLLLGVGIFGAAWALSDDIGNLFISWYPWEWGKEVFEKIFTVTGGLVVALIGLLIYKNVVMVAAGPFMSFLSEKVERALLGKSTAKVTFLSVARDFVRGLRVALRNMWREIFYTVILLIIGLFPGFTPFTTILIFVVQAFYGGFNNFDFFLERHFGVRESVGYVRRNRWLVIGNGTVFLLLLLTGIGFLIAPTLGAIAATVEGTKRLGEDRP